MPDKNSRYNMEISYKITRPDGKGYTRGSLFYDDMDYLQITVTQAMIAEFAKSLTEMGFAMAEEIFPEEVKAAKEKLKK